MIDPIALTKSLLAFDTTNPPGREGECGRFLARELEALGFAIETQSFGEDRLNIVARLAGSDAAAAQLVLTGHIDTVPLGDTQWSVDPFAGEMHEGRLYGRGVTDMKAGVAAMVAAASRFLGPRRPPSGLTLIFTSGEETGCAGALAFAEEKLTALGKASALLVGEPTGNRISTAHKGCVALRAKARGVTAHSSMPEMGRNAVVAAAGALLRVSEYVPSGLDPLLGSPSLNIGMFHGGMNYNSVPDSAEFTVDVRTVPGMAHDDVEAALAAILGEEIDRARFVDMPPVTTDPQSEFALTVADAVRSVMGEAADLTPLGTPFFSDASVFQPRLRCPTIILGPGEPSLAHQTDEWCYESNIRAAADIYTAIIDRWRPGCPEQT
ncbi:succinyl-diaminopimelate desuccinylase [Sphingomonas sp. UYAg733]